MQKTLVLLKRELAGYFATPVAYVFIVVFLLIAGILTWQVSNFYEAGQASLVAFFNWHPWLYLFLIPAISMRLWAEERKTGTVELLMTLPVTTWQAVMAKFLAAWAFTGVALALTFPMWMTVSYLGNPDHGVILASYIGSFLMAGAYLAIGACLSAVTKNQVIAFVLSVVVCVLFILIGLPGLGTFLPEKMIEIISTFSFLTHFNSIMRGLIDLRDVVFFVSIILCFLFANAIVIEAKKAD